IVCFRHGLEDLGAPDAALSLQAAVVEMIIDFLDFVPLAPDAQCFTYSSLHILPLALLVFSPTIAACSKKCSRRTVVAHNLKQGRSDNF
ncbi:unnamed protein product, partial [Ectocarpus sp. 12 AP-2014]